LTFVMVIKNTDSNKQQLTDIVVVAAKKKQ